MHHLSQPQGKTVSDPSPKIPIADQFSLLLKWLQPIPFPCLPSPTFTKALFYHSSLSICYLCFLNTWHLICFILFNLHNHLLRCYHYLFSRNSRLRSHSGASIQTHHPMLPSHCSSPYSKILFDCSYLKFFQRYWHTLCHIIYSVKNSFLNRNICTWLKNSIKIQVV